jgi:tetratricopeptide (TPR) repeat protein
MERKLMLILLLACFLTNVISAQQELFDKGNKAYQEGNYELALQNYQELLQGDKHSAELYYNTGLSYFQLENWPYAILYFEKAQKINPRLKGVKKSLEFAKSNLPEQVVPIPDFFLSRWWRFFVNVFSVDIWTAFQLVFLFLTVVGIALWLLSKNLVYKKYGFFTFIVSIGICLICLLAAHSREQMVNNSGEGIIIVPAKVSLLKAPDTKSPEVSPLFGGEKVYLLDELAGWKKVEMEDREEGWVKEEWLKEI